jgi:serine/threonine protein kinase/tetratricopeptide (TPR) repeat protein
MKDALVSEKSIFEAAVEMISQGERAAFLDKACGPDQSLRKDVEMLLSAHDRLGSQPVDPSPDPRTALREPMAFEPLGSVIGPYKLMEQIGEGGMGLVYVAEQHHPVRRKVALKLIKPGMDTRQVIARFEAERQALAVMNHPNIAKVFDGGETPSGRPYFVMELVRGVPITEYCDEHRLTPRARLELFLQVCAAVQHAHQKGIIHRDIKPSNVMIASHDGTPVVKVIDFGVAKAIGQQLTDKTVYTHFAQFIGTPLYMSPEQAGQSALDIDTRTDIYALGVLLYELLTGTTPFDKERLHEASYDEIRRLIREEEPPKPSTRMSTLNAQAGSTLSAQRQSNPRELSLLLRGELDWIVMKSLEKDRNRRYESANSLAADLERYLKDEPVQACPPSRRYLLEKFLRRHRTGVLTTTALLAAALVIAVGSGYMVLDRADRHAKIEQKVEVALAGARTAIEAGDLTLARQRVAEAHTYLATERERLPVGDADCNRLLKEIEARQADQSRLREFLKLANDGQDKMAYDGLLGGDVQAKEALDLFGVLQDDLWMARLDNSYLTAGQKEQIRETAYVTLLSLADVGLRWAPGYPETAQRSVDLLRRAEALQAPTRAFYFVRSECHRLRGNTAAAAEDVKRFRETLARTALDHYLPGHSAGWYGDYQEAVRAYRAALDLQPNHYNALYFLAQRLCEGEIKRLPEAIQLNAACSALRPEHILPYTNRADGYHKLGQLEEAETAYAVAIASAKSEADRAWSYALRLKFYKALGRTEKAREDEKRAIALYEQVLAKPIVKHDRESLSAMNNLAILYCDAGRLLEGMALHQQTLEKRKATLGPDDPCTLQSMHSLAYNYREAGRLPEAIALYEEMFDRTKAKLGPDHPDTLINLHNLAEAHGKAGRLQKAIDLHEQALEVRKVKRGLDHVDTLKSMNQLAGAYRKAGRLQEAIELSKQIQEKRKATLGPDHADTLQAMSLLALGYRDTGRLPEAIALLEEVLKNTEAKFGPDHLDTLQSMSNLAISYGIAGRRPEAIALLERTLEKKKFRLGPDHLNTLRSMNNLAHFYRNGRLKDAIAMLEQMLELSKTKHGSDHPFTLMSMGNLAIAYEDAGRRLEAIELHEQTLAKTKAKLGPDHPDTLHSMNELAGSYQRGGKLDEANQLLRDLLEHERKKDGTKATLADGMLAKLGLNLLKQERYVEAEPLLRECLAIREKQLPDDWRRFNTLSQLGGALLGQKNYADAEALLLEGYEGMKQREAKIPSEGKIRVTEAIERIVRLYEATEQTDKARTWRDKLSGGKTSVD